MSVDSLSDEPNPLGDEILFFSSDGSKSYQKSLELNKKKNNILNNSKYDNINDYENEENNTVNHEEISVVNSELREDTESQTKQRQRYFAMYSTEAALLALECADSARMKHSIGKVFMVHFWVFYYIVKSNRTVK